MAPDIARDRWRLRLAGSFDRSNAELVGRTRAPDAAGFRHVDAARGARPLTMSGSVKRLDQVLD